MTPETTIWAIWVAWWISWIAAAAWSDRAVKRPPNHQQILYRFFNILGYVLLFGAYRHQLATEIVLWSTPSVLAWGMVGLVLGGLLFTWWARIHLGRLWSSSVTRKAGHHVVDSGPYGIVRHPIYTGIIVASMATAATRGTALSWIGMGVMTLGWVIKARLEEKFLREQLGAEAYDEYASRVPMLVPLLG